MKLRFACSVVRSPCAPGILTAAAFPGQPFGAAVAVSASLRCSCENALGGLHLQKTQTTSCADCSDSTGTCGPGLGARGRPETTPSPRQRSQGFRRAFMHNLTVCKICHYKNHHNAAKPGARPTRNASWPAAATAAQAPRPRIAVGVQAARRRAVYFPRRLAPCCPSARYPFPKVPRRQYMALKCTSPN